MLSLIDCSFLFALLLLRSIDANDDDDISSSVFILILVTVSTALFSSSLALFDRDDDS